MSNSVQLAARLKEVFIHGKWIANTNYKEQISQTSWKQAVTRINHLNSVAMLTFHINYYLEGLTRVLEGGPLDISDKYSFDMPTIDTEETWKAMVDTFLMNAEKFSNLVELLSDEKLQGPFVKEEYGTYLRNIEGVLEHSYYHLGQLVLVRKMIGQEI